MNVIDARTREKVTRLLMLATSPVDAEALTSIRKATAILAGHGLSWEDVLAQPAQTQRPPTTARSPARQRRAPEGAVPMAEAYLIITELQAGGLDEAALDFVLSVEAFMLARGFITAKQAEALRRMRARQAA